MTHIICILLRSELHEAILLMLVCHTVLWEVHIHCSSIKSISSENQVTAAYSWLWKGQLHRRPERTLSADDAMHGQAVQCESLLPRRCTNRARGQTPCMLIVAIYAAGRLCWGTSQRRPPWSCALLLAGRSPTGPAWTKSSQTSSSVICRAPSRLESGCVLLHTAAQLGFNRHGEAGCALLCQADGRKLAQA